MLVKLLDPCHTGFEQSQEYDCSYRAATIEAYSTIGDHISAIVIAANNEAATQEALRNLEVVTPSFSVAAP